MRFFVLNRSGKDINEFKPGIGAFTLVAKQQMEIFDFWETIKDFRGEVILDSEGNPLKRIKHTAQEIAEGIVRDRQIGDLELVIKEDEKVQAEAVVLERITDISERIKKMQEAQRSMSDAKSDGQKPIGE